MITSKPPGTPAIPNDPASVTKGTPAIPNDPNSVTKGAVAIPNDPASVTKAAPAIPNDPASVTKAAPAIPNDPSSVTKGAVAIPNDPAVVNAAAHPRTLTPLVQMLFDAGCYSQCGEPVAFEDLFTYTRNSSATFINRRVVCGKSEYFLDTDFVGTVTNLLTYSEQFDNAAWTKSNVTTVSNDDLAPDLTKTADKIYPSTTGTLRGVNQAVTLTTADHTVGFYVKADGVKWVNILDPDGANGVWFNIAIGEIGTVSSGSIGKITPVGDDWYLCEVTSAGAVSGFGQIILTDGDNTTTITADGTKGVLIWGAQVTLSSKPEPYVKTVASSASDTFAESLRVEYDPETGENLGALIEGASTNLALRSEEFDNASWTKTDAAITSNNILAPDGTTSGDKLTELVTVANHRVFQSVSTVSSTDHSFSIYAKRSERRYIFMRETLGADTFFDLQLGVIVSGVGTIVDMGGGWFRCSIVSESSPGGAFIGQCGTSDDGINSSFLGVVGYGAFLWGAQIEVLPFATSYTRTEGSTVSRTADNLSASSIGRFETGSISTQADSLGILTSNQYVVSIGEDVNNSVSFLTRSNDANVRLLINESSINQVDLASVDNFLEMIKAAASLDNDVVNAYSNGVNYGSDVEFILPLNTKMQIGGNLSGGIPLYGHIKTLEIYDTALTAQEVALL